VRQLPRLTVVPLISLLAIGLSGCEAVNTASEGLDKAQVCTQAVQAAGFDPDLSNPDQTVQDAQQKAQELRELADRTTDPDLQRELHNMAGHFAELGPEDLSPNGSIAWAQQKVNTLNQLQAACGGSGGEGEGGGG
jgi:hypothetical protein